MIDFQPVRLGDKAAIEQFTLACGSRNCDFAFANMYCWHERYRSEWAVTGGFLVIRFRLDGGSAVGYMQPVGEGDFSAIVPLLEADARALGEPLRIVGLTDEGCEVLRRAYPDVFAFASLRAAEDYIYLAEDLRLLSGRRYQPKRNHLNRFAASYPDCRYEPLTAHHADECLALEREWQRRRDTESNDADLTSERRAMQLGFAHFDTLGMRGGALYVGDRLVAFTYGSAVSRDTFVIHAEKADTRFEGAFAMINRSFAATLPPEFTYINREEDLGIAGLRKSKLSYHPSLMLRKFTALKLDDDARQCRELWRTVFGDEESFIDSFLLHHRDDAVMLSRRIDGQIVSMLHIIPFRTSFGSAAYIYGVATHPDHRGRGYSSSLLCEAVDVARSRGDKILFLIPDAAKPWLRDYYARFGFGGLTPVRFTSRDDFDFGTGNPSDDIAMTLLLDASVAPIIELDVEERAR